MSKTQEHRLLKFFEQQTERPKSLTILMHDHPDPDAIASAFALSFLVGELYGIKATLAHGGMVGRMENRVMVDELKIPLEVVQPAHLEDERRVVLVDTQPPFANNVFPRDGKPYMVIDHHPRHPRTKADFVLISTRFGATTTILVQALNQMLCRIPKPVATALAYGISSETQHLGREATCDDIEAYLSVLPKANMRLLGRMQYPPRQKGYFQTLGTAIHNAFVRGRLIGAHLGEVSTPDLVAQAADFFLAYEGMRWALCTGRYQDRLHVSLRVSSLSTSKAGDLLNRVLGRQGRAGGHVMIAGGSLEVSSKADETHWQQLEQQVVERLVRQLKLDPSVEFAWPFRVDTKQ